MASNQTLTASSAGRSNGSHLPAHGAPPLTPGREGGVWFRPPASTRGTRPGPRLAPSSPVGNPPSPPGRARARPSRAPELAEGLEGDRVVLPQRPPPRPGLPRRPAAAAGLPRDTRGRGPDRGRGRCCGGGRWGNWGAFRRRAGCGSSGGCGRRRAGCRRRIFFLSRLAGLAIGAGHGPRAAFAAIGRRFGGQGDGRQVGVAVRVRRLGRHLGRLRVALEHVPEAPGSGARWAAGRRPRRPAGASRDGGVLGRVGGVRFRSDHSGLGRRCHGRI